MATRWDNACTQEDCTVTAAARSQESCGDHRNFFHGLENNVKKHAFDSVFELNDIKFSIHVIIS